jgi:methylthioribose-1-phosphate isomerase
VGTEVNFDAFTKSAPALVIVAIGVALALAAPKIGAAIADVIRARADSHKAKADDMRIMTESMKVALAELRPNHGGSIKDAITRIDKQLSSGTERFALIEKSLEDARKLAEERHDRHTSEHGELMAAIGGKADKVLKKPTKKL